MQTSPALSDLISAEYLAEQKRLHADPRGYGGRGDKWVNVVGCLISDRGCTSVLDYGCGQGTLYRAMKGHVIDGIQWRNYDPAQEAWNHLPVKPYDLVVCTDVLEHIEPEKITAVVRHLRSLTRVELFTVISLVETAKTLSDGRQAHILLQDENWWTHMMQSEGFERTAIEFPNPKPEKQLVTSWRPI